MNRTSRMVAHRFAETMLFWRKSMRAVDLAEYLGVSERTARSLIQEWRVEGLLPAYTKYPRGGIKPDPDFNPGPPANDFEYHIRAALDRQGFCRKPFFICSAFQGAGMT